MKSNLRFTVAVLFCATGLSLAGSAHACQSLGLVKRVDGDLTQAILERNGAQGSLRVLEIVCAGDLIQAHGAKVLISVNGQADVTVGPNNAYQLPSAAPVSYADNAYRIIDEKIWPDAARIRMELRVKGGSEPFEFSVAGLIDGAQEINLDRRTLLVRVTGGVAPFTGRLTDSSGLDVETQSQDGTLIFTGLNLKEGSVAVEVADSRGVRLKGAFMATAKAVAPNPDFKSLIDPEVRAAVEAIDLAKSAPRTRMLEAEQQLNAAPRKSLDREPVYAVIESYEEP